VWHSAAVSQPPPERIKLRMKLGEHEFDAEGAPELVAGHLRTWQSLVAARSPAAAGSPAAGGPAAASTANGSSDVFAVDEQRKLVTLRVHPRSKTPRADAALLLLYALQRTWYARGGAVPATRVQAALSASGYARSRINRTLETYRRAGLVRQRGRRKASTYQLTATGIQRADALAATRNGPFA
jgi:hypothetical protein